MRTTPVGDTLGMPSNLASPLIQPHSSSAFRLLILEPTLDLGHTSSSSTTASSVPPLRPWKEGLDQVSDSINNTHTTQHTLIDC